MSISTEVDKVDVQDNLLCGTYWWEVKGNDSYDPNPWSKWGMMHQVILLDTTLVYFTISTAKYCIYNLTTRNGKNVVLYY